MANFGDFRAISLDFYALSRIFMIYMTPHVQ